MIARDENGRSQLHDVRKAPQQARTVHGNDDTNRWQLHECSEPDLIFSLIFFKNITLTYSFTSQTFNFCEEYFSNVIEIK
jgi:hypothetical protein